VFSSSYPVHPFILSKIFNLIRKKGDRSGPPSSVLHPPVQFTNTGTAFSADHAPKLSFALTVTV
jgi:hypothetical protein